MLKYDDRFLHSKFIEVADANPSAPVSSTLSPALQIETNQKPVWCIYFAYYVWQ